MKPTFGIVMALIVTVMPGASIAAAPATMSYQGVLEDASGASLPDGSYQLTFGMYEAASGGSPVWSEVLSVDLAGGVFNVILGKVASLSALPFDRAYWLGITLSGESEFAPRTELAASPYARRAAVADALAGGGGDSDWVVDGDNVYRLTGNVGIGTASPSERLDVAGAARMTGFKMPTGAAAGRVLTSDASGTGTWQAGSGGADADWVIDGGNMYAGVSGNVGIGTAAPLSKLSLGVDLNPKKLAIWDGTDDFYGFGAEWGRMTFYAMNVERLSLLSNGYLGINNTAPVTILDAQGYANAQAILRLNQVGTDSWTGLRLDREGAEKWFVGLPSYADNFVVRRSASADDFAIDTSGRVGIGTGNPGSAKLAVMGGRVGLGTTNPQADLHLYKDSGVGTTSLRMENYGDTFWDVVADAGALTISSNITSDVLVLKDAAIGIGTFSPNSETKLHVRANSDDFGVLVDVGGSNNSRIGIHTASSGYAGLAKNAYFAGGWQRFDQGSGAFLEQVSPDGTVNFYVTAFGTNPITWTTPLTLNTDGSAQCPVLKITGGSDLAEPFDVGNAAIVEPGSVVCIDPARPGKLRVSDRAYDRCVAGIVSGAGDVRPGMIMGQRGTLASGDHPVALTGRVYCRATAENGAIEPGDLLTTSDTPGLAMKVTDADLAQGAILGKAMSPLAQGDGLVLVLVTLQ